MNILDKIINVKKQELEKLKQEFSLKDLELLAQNHSKREFVGSLVNKSRQKQPAIIAEVKKSSPSKGIIRENFNYLEIAKSYELNGATCISVLTDTTFFGGKNDYLTEIKQHVSLPIIRKDFIIDELQIIHSKAIGADAILLIASCLDEDQLQHLYTFATSYNLDVLIEVHNSQEFNRALKLNPKIIGVNNRDLQSFNTDIQNTIDIAEELKLKNKELALVTESGIKNRTDIEKMFSHGIYCFLVGETFMRAEDPGAKLHEMFFTI